MNTKLIMIEGITGSGKTTMANKIHSHLNQKGEKTNLYVEGCLHPADLAWCAYVPLARYQQLLIEYDQISDEIKEYSSIEGEYAVIAYTQIKTEDHSFYEELSNFEVYDARVPFDFFNAKILNRWKSFAESAASSPDINIFECAFLQNHVSELLGFYNADEDEIWNHLENILRTVTKLEPTLIYLSHASITDTVNRVSEERVAEGSNPAWIDLIAAWVANSPYGRIHKLTGFEGVIRFLEKRKEIELNVIPKLPLESIVIQNDSFDWENIWLQMEGYLEGL